MNDIRPSTYRCTNCGCLWRHNLACSVFQDGSLSLYDADQKSCVACEPAPLPVLERVADALLAMPYPNYTYPAQNMNVERDRAARYAKTCVAMAFRTMEPVVIIDMNKQSQEAFEALRRLTFAARTSGGTAGRDHELCSACEHAEAVIAKTGAAPDLLFVADKDYSDRPQVATDIRRAEFSGPAFPSTGMTLRDYFAACCAATLCGLMPSVSDTTEVARRAYALADAMLAKRITQSAPRDAV